ncbi:hypothetical protein FOZ60_011205 [Perkinsus olseni]|uniref:DNL-type domain-containing protein n=1 Tax=Perkinsus olseni TaxID=32597 RepID=A0A7J6NF10_PEROL|nr:hypothetical protein FOZ60_011205 [Perkinsus olseni]
MLAGFSFISLLLLDSFSLVSADRQHTVSALILRPSEFTMHDYEAMLEAGASRLILGSSIARASGTVPVPGDINVTFMSEIHDLTQKYKAEVYLSVSPLFSKGENTSGFEQGFADSIREHFKKFYLDGVLVDSYAMPDYVEAVQTMGDIVRASYTWSENRAVAALQFSSDEDSWSFVEQVDPSPHFHYAICSLDNDSISPEIYKSLAWADQALQNWDNITRSPSSLEFQIIPEGHKTTGEALSYRELVHMGAPTEGSGEFDGYYYDSQTQIREKARLVTSVNMQGITFVGLGGDLPISDGRSLLHEPQTIEDILREKGETVVKGTVKDASKADQTVVAGAIADAVDDRGEIKLREGETLPDVQIEGLDEDSIRKLQLEIVRKQREEQDAVRWICSSIGNGWKNGEAGVRQVFVRLRVAGVGSQLYLLFLLFHMLASSRLPLTLSRSFMMVSTTPTPIRLLTTLAKREHHSAVSSAARRGLRGTVPLTRLPLGSTEAADVSSYNITYTCRDCSTKGAWMISKHSYHHGMVGVQCPGCGQAHLISDSLGCFAGIPRSDHVRIRERFEDLISSSARMYGDLPDQHKFVLITMLFVVGVRSAPHDDEAEVLSGVISLLSWVLQFTLPLVFVGIYFKLTNGRTAPIRRAAVEKVEVVEGGEKVGSDGNSFDMAPRMSDDDDCGHDGKSSDYDGDSEGSVGDDEDSASEETDGKMGKSCEKLFAESFVIDENELESTDDLLRRINEDNDDSCRGDDDDGRSEISSPEASPIVHNTFGEDNIWKPKSGSSNCSSPANLPVSTLPNSWDAFDAVPAGNDGSYLGTSLDEVLEFNEKCEAEASGEGHQELYNGLEDHRRDENEPDVGQARSTEAKNAAARQALELAIERYPREAAFVCHQLLQNLTSEKILIQPETYDLMIRAAEVSGHQGLASLLYSNAGRANQQPSSVRVSYPSPGKQAICDAGRTEFWEQSAQALSGGHSVSSRERRSSCSNDEVSGRAITTPADHAVCRGGSGRYCVSSTAAIFTIYTARCCFSSNSTCRQRSSSHSYPPGSERHGGPRDHVSTTTAAAADECSRSEINPATEGGPHDPVDS